MRKRKIEKYIIVILNIDNNTVYNSTNQTLYSKKQNALDSMKRMLEEEYVGLIEGFSYDEKVYEKKIDIIHDCGAIFLNGKIITEYAVHRITNEVL